MTVYVFDFNMGEWIDGGEDAKELLIESIAMMYADHVDKK